MKTTKELFGLDPRMFKRMTYESVLALKRAEIERKLKAAHEETFAIGFYSLTAEELARVQELNAQVKEGNKALEYVRLWQDEMV